MAFFGPPPQTRFVLFDTTETTSASTSFVNSATTITLPSGTYTYEGLVGGTTNSGTGGVQVESTLATGYAISAYQIAYRGNTVDNYFGTTFHNIATRVDTNSDLLVAVNLDGGVGKSAAYNMKGVLVLTGDATFGFRIKQRTTTDASNPAKLMIRSYIAFTRV